VSATTTQTAFEAGTTTHSSLKRVLEARLKPPTRVRVLHDYCVDVRVPFEARTQTGRVPARNCVLPDEHGLGWTLQRRRRGMRRAIFVLRELPARRRSR
jgi:hypothetical protein